MKMLCNVLAAAMTSVLLLSGQANAASGCNRLFDLKSPQALDDFEYYSQEENFFRQTSQGPGYQLQFLVLLAYGHIRNNCQELQQLPRELQSQEGYISYFLRINGLRLEGPLSKDTILLQRTFNQRAQAGGFSLGLTGSTARTASSATAAPQAPARPRAGGGSRAAPAKRSAPRAAPAPGVIPGCGSACQTAGF